MNYYLFCDESGNSGSNALNKDDPFYIHMGWLIREDKLERVASLITSYKGNADELKSEKMLRKPAGQKKATKLIQEMLRLNCIPFVSVLEYRFSIAMRIVEFLFDPLYNKSVDNKFEIDFNSKKVFASIVYEYPDEILESFFIGFKKYDTVIVKQSIIGMINTDIDCNKSYRYVNEYINSEDLKEYINKLKRYLETSLDHLEDNLFQMSVTAKSMDNNVMMSLNLPMFVVFIQTIQNFCHENQISVEIIHDESKEFEAGYRKVIELYGENISEERITFNDNSSIMISNKIIKGFTFQKDEVEKCIQIADLFAGSLNRCLKKEMDQDLVNTVLPILFCYLDKNKTLCRPRISNQQLIKIYHKITDVNIARSLYGNLKIDE